MPATTGITRFQGYHAVSSVSRETEHRRETVRKILVFAAPLLVLAASGGIVFALFAAKPEPEKEESGPRPISLFVDEVRQEPVTLTVTTQGEIRPLAEIDLVPQVAGRIVYVAPEFVEGGIVEAGEVLVRIEDSDYGLAIIRAEARVAEAELKLARQEADAEIVAKQWKWEKLENDEPTALGLRKPQVAEARAQVKAAEADLEAARLDLQRTKITVPFKGRVREKLVDIGQYVTPGTKLGRAFSTEVVEVRLPLTDTQMASIGLPIAFHAEPGEEGPIVNFHAAIGGAERTWIGHITRTDAAIDRQTRLMYAIAEVEDPYGAGADSGVPLPVGLFVSAEIAGRSLAEAYVLPRAALRTRSQVFVVDADNLLRIRSVDVVHMDDQRVILLDGVEEGEQVVVSPVQAPREGMPVTPLRRQSAQHLAKLSQ